MTAPRTEIVWGEGDWQPGQIEAVQPMVVAGISLAEDGLEHFKIDAGEPKRATISAVEDDCKFSGEAEDMKDLFIYLPQRVVDSINPNKYFPKLVFTAAHELTHCSHEEQNEDLDVVEALLVGEGIAYHVERAIGGILLDEDEFISEFSGRHYYLSPDVESAVLDQLRIQLNQLDVLDKHIDDETIDMVTDRFWEKWFIGGSSFLPNGVKLGMMAVERLLEQGATFPELLKMPPADIIKVEL